MKRALLLMLVIITNVIFVYMLEFPEGCVTRTVPGTHTSAFFQWSLQSLPQDLVMMVIAALSWWAFLKYTLTENQAKEWEKGRSARQHAREMEAAKQRALKEGRIWPPPPRA